MLRVPPTDSRAEIRNPQRPQATGEQARHSASCSSLLPVD